MFKYYIITPNGRFKLKATCYADAAREFDNHWCHESKWSCPNPVARLQEVRTLDLIQKPLNK